jgi:hypothetical protein
MKRRNIKKIKTDPNSYGDEAKQFPRVTIRPGTNKVHNPRTAMQSRSFNRTSRKALEAQPNQPVNFLRGEITKSQKDICFVVGGGPSLSGFDFSQLNGYDTIAVNKAVEYIQNPTYFITTDYSYFIKATLPIERIRQKCQYTYFIANMTPKYMQYKDGMVMDTRSNMVYRNLYKYSGVIESNQQEGFGSDVKDFRHGSNSGHCGIQLALLAGYKKIYLLGFDLTTNAQTHFHQSYRQQDQESFKKRVGGYAQTLLRSLTEYKGSQQIINLSSQSILNDSPHIKTQSFAEVLAEQGEVPARNIAHKGTLQDLIVVGYYTIDTPYEEEAQNLLRSLNKLGISHDISGVNTLGSWQANTRFKANFMLDMLIKWPKHRLLYIDCDAVVHRSPDLFKNYKCDIAVRWQDFRWRKNECLSGTIYMENNERTKRICELWRDINVKEGNASNRMEQWNLDAVITQMKKENPSFTYKNLPPEYTMIFDSMRGMYPNIVPVIEHFQASRRFRKDVND